MKLCNIRPLIVLFLVLAIAASAQSQSVDHQSSRKLNPNHRQRIYERADYLEQALFQNFANVKSAIDRNLALTVQGTAAVVFNDPNLEQAVRDALGKPTGEITEADMASLTMLVANDKGITDLTGLEYAINLNTLFLRQNQISDLTPIQNCCLLVQLYLDTNYLISDITPLSNMTHLAYVGLSNNAISSIAALQNAYGLINLSMNNNQVADISPLQNHFQLDCLIMGNNLISDISALHNLTSITTLYLHGNQIQDISALSNLVNLVDIYMPDNLINDISPLQNLTNLQSLAISGNQIADLSPLQNLTNLAALGCNDNQVSDVTPLQNLINLSTLNLGNNQISDIAGIAGLVNLISVRLDGNQLDNDDLPMMYDWDSLTSLDLRNNPGITSGTAMQTLGDNLDSMNCEDILWDGICGQDPVPVELSSFQASEKNGGVRLTWTTESESNSFGFQIEKSNNQQQFQPIGFVAGRGTTTSATSYEFLDQKVGSGTTYYRLKMIDLDGTFEYSGIVEITLHAPAAYRLEQNFPNPFNSKTMISFSIPEKARVQIAVFDLTGQQVLTLTSDVYEAGTHHLTLDAQRLPSGTYYYKMIAGEFSTVQKLVVLK